MINKTFFILIFSCLSFVPISNYSLWIDESTTAYLASQPSVNELNKDLFNARTSEVQMPGYIYYMWAWEKIFGHNEFFLRLSNLPFMIILFTLIAFSPLTDRMKTIMSCFIVFSPFLWYNLNEARSTIAIFSFAGLSVLSLVYYFSGIKSLQKKGVWIFTASIILGVSFNMLFLFFIPVIALLFLFQSITGKWKVSTLIKNWWLGVCLMTVMISALIIYFLWTLSKGAGGYKETPAISNSIFALYEFLGFSGVGPPRNLLRVSRSLEMIKPYIPLMLLYTSSYILMFVFVFRGSWKRYRMRNVFLSPYLITFVIGILVFSFVSYLSHFRFWGRHAAFLLPLLFLYFSQLVDDYLTSEPLKYKFLMPLIPLFILILISDLNIRFNADYQKENNKEASIKSIELTDNQDIVIWNGLDQLAAYYGLKVNDSQLDIPETWPVYRNAIIPVYSSNLADYLNNFRGKKSVLVVFNRQDFDKEGYYKDYITNSSLSVLVKKRDYSIYSMQ